MSHNPGDIDSTGLIDVGDVKPAFEDDMTEPPDNIILPSDILRQDSSDQSQGPAIAEIRDRFAAMFMDCLLLYLLYWPLMLIYRSIAFGAAAGPVPATGTHGIIFNGTFLFLALLWFILPEMVFNASPGKLLCHLSVRKMDGTPASFGSILLRNIFRPIDILLFPILLLTGMLEWSGWHRRLGDVLGGTVVIKRLGSMPKQYALSLDIIASATRRVAAFSFDLVLLLGFVFGYGLLLNPQNPVGSMFLMVMLPVVCVFFFLIPEWIFKTSPGKWIFGMMICSEEGSSINMVSAIVRTVWRIFDNNPFGFLTMLLSVRKQRPGDSAASTVIIHVQREARGFIGLVLWFLIVGSIAYSGINNRDSFLSSDFQINFLPSIDLSRSSAPATAEVVKNLSIKNFTFAEGEEKAPRRPSIYEPGEIVFMLFDVDGYQTKEDKVWIQEDLTISYPDGSMGLKLENINDFNEELTTSGPIRFENNIALPANAMAGRYTVTLSIRDRIANKDLKEQRFFYVTPSDSEPTGVEGDQKPKKTVVEDKTEVTDTPSESADTPPQPVNPSRTLDTN